jgi:hypothetical protein
LVVSPSGVGKPLGATKPHPITTGVVAHGSLGSRQSASQEQHVVQ